ncbi:tyrosyl-DNA Phosphodiesterase (Tdp1) [Trypanosoma theileri]|uniref:Tyrosyl-DNA Phosphodiesterase (Tdp1) n=1 Tax=Trypanosoma theileri TaxID=67003 RepID=A0A1X0NRE8_9TRYP|nr:tyrosyl-DNA Phosphodiesterase (Tdp1) [Trypanosoma theileri]ORC87267.1 tyrosyl-DNA Phosphodiesterase (Tdp1) [Trypanosoma theileri]
MRLLCPFWVNKIDALSIDSPSALTLRDLLCTNVDDQNEVWSYVLLANFLFDMEWLFSVAPSLLQTKKKLFLVSGEKGLAQQFSSSSFSGAIDKGRIRFIEPKLPLPFGVHHTKLAICVNENGIRVAIFTANFIESDWSQKTQGIYVQDFPKRSNIDKVTEESYIPLNIQDNRGNRFKNELRRYLNSYNVFSSLSDENGIPNTLFDEFDFSNASVELISSVPGYHRGSDAYLFGMGRIESLLESLYMGTSDKSETPLLTWQFSSQGRLTDAFLVKMESAMVSEIKNKDISEQFRPMVQVVYPTESEVRDSLEGWIGGLSLPLRLACCHPYINKRLYRWGFSAKDMNDNKITRKQSVPHIKSYMRLTEKKDALKWVILTSANLSRAAWGEWQKKGTQLAIRSYELGVFYDSESFIQISDELFSVTPSRPIPLPSSVEGDGLIEVRIKKKEKKGSQDEPILFLPYDPLNPEPYASTLQLQKSEGSEDKSPLIAKDRPWVIDIPHFGKDALGKDFHEALKTNNSIDHTVDEISSLEKKAKMENKNNRSLDL